MKVSGIKNCITIDKGTTSKFVKSMRKNVKISSAYTAGSTLFTSYFVATKELAGTAVFAAQMGYFANELINSLAKLADAKYIKTRSGISYNDVLKRAKQIYKK